MPVELPPPVLDRLSVHGPVRLTTGDGRHAVEAHLAPIHEALDALIPGHAPALADILADGRAEFFAEDRARDYLIRVKARAVPGRRVPAEPRRSELTHWMPEGKQPADYLVVHLFPDFLEFTRTEGGERARAMGPIPGAALPNPLVVWAELALRGLWPWVPVAVGLDWVYVLFSREASLGRWFLLLLTVTMSLTWLVACGLFEEWAQFVRWREGIGRAAAGRIAEGWAAVDRVLLGAKIGAGVGLAVGLLCGLAAGFDLVACALVASGAPALAPFYGIRHFFRRSDAAEGSP